MERIDSIEPVAVGARPRAAAPVSARPRALRPSRQEYLLLAFLLAHVPLALVLHRFDALATLHALAVLGLGLLWAVKGRIERAIQAACYMTGAEVLWRMSGFDLFWEFGKYAVILILLVAFVRLPSRQDTAWSALVYLLLLVPSATLTIQVLDLSVARDALSFNLSGPLCLAVAVFVFSSLRASALDLRVVVFSLLAPILGVMAICTRSTVTADWIQFYAESNFVTSGGFGPNQVSAVLGLGAVLSLLIAIESSRPLLRWVFFGVTVAILTQGILTFSRGGVINAVICMGFLVVHLIQQPRVRATVLGGLVLLTFLGSTVILPRLNEWTGGALEERYSTTAVGLRQTLAEEELKLWRDHPLLGVGPGMGKYYRADLLGMEVAAHTEFTRLLAEHGSFGAVALMLLVGIATRAYLRAPSAVEKAWVSALAGWSFLEMSHSSMRIAVISFLFGLACLSWSPQRPR